MPADSMTRPLHALDLRAAGFPIVCIGMSAGAVEPVRILFRGLSPKTGMIFVLVHHLRQEYVTHLPEILSPCTSMPIRLVESGLAFEPNHIYVITPGEEIGLTDDLFTSQPRTKKRGFANVISLFLESLTNSHHRGIAVILSGMYEDGAAELTAFKQRGGITMAQAPDTAAQRGMPAAAIETGAVDYVLSPEAMPGQLEKIARHFNSAN